MIFPTVSMHLIYGHMLFEAFLRRKARRPLTPTRKDTAFSH